MTRALTRRPQHLEMVLKVDHRSFQMVKVEDSRLNQVRQRVAENWDRKVMARQSCENGAVVDGRRPCHKIEVEGGSCQ